MSVKTPLLQAICQYQTCHPMILAKYKGHQNRMCSKFYCVTTKVYPNSLLVEDSTIHIHMYKLMNCIKTKTVINWPKPSVNSLLQANSKDQSRPVFCMPTYFSYERVYETPYSMSCGLTGSKNQFQPVFCEPTSFTMNESFWNTIPHGIWALQVKEPVSTSILGSQGTLILTHCSYN